MVPNLVLVADDVEDDRVVLRAILEHAGFGVLLARNGREAVEQARTHRPTLIIMDLLMPVMDGWEATHLLRDDLATVGIPIVAFTAYDHPDLPEKLQRAGFCAHLKKPCPLPQVIGAITRCLAAASGGQPWVDLPPADLTRPPERWDGPVDGA